jgi:hypothetical protein
VIHDVPLSGDSRKTDTVGVDAAIKDPDLTLARDGILPNKQFSDAGADGATQNTKLKTHLQRAKRDALLTSRSRQLLDSPAA